MSLEGITGTQVSFGTRVSRRDPFACFAVRFGTRSSLSHIYDRNIGSLAIESVDGQPSAAVSRFSFVSGFTLLFILYGASASLIGRFFITNQRLMAQIAGVLVAGFGLHTMGILRIPGLDMQKKWDYRGESGKPHHSLFIGMAFAAGWTPCVGPILGGILAMASVNATLWDGVKLLLFYAAGMGLPFLLMAATLGKANRLLNALKRRYRTIEIVRAYFLSLSVSCYTPTPSPLWPIFQLSRLAVSPVTHPFLFGFPQFVFKLWGAGLPVL